ncbi:hypothetical protein AAZX31_15G245200 [Glycine max]
MEPGLKNVKEGWKRWICSHPVITIPYTKMDGSQLPRGTQIHEVSKDTRLPPSHLLPTMSDTGSSQARTTRATVQGGR